MLNHIIMMGRLTRDPELRHTQTGVAVCSFSIACERDYKNASGERDTDFFDVVTWRSTAEFASRYFNKGRMAVVEGRLQNRNWTDKEGNKRYTTRINADNVYFGDSKPQAQAQEGDDGQPPKGFVPDFGDADGEPPEGFVPDFGDEDGELPF